MAKAGCPDSTTMSRAAPRQTHMHRPTLHRTLQTMRLLTASKAVRQGASTSTPEDKGTECHSPLQDSTGITEMMQGQETRFKM